MSRPRLVPPQWYSRQALAEHQLDRAIRLLLEERDAVCSLTLAGAAEEILGKIVEEGGGRSSLGSFIDVCLMMGRLSHGEDWKPGTFADMANHTRNALKHHGDGTEVAVTEDMACEMLDRAVENLAMTGARQSEQVDRYFAYRFSR
jgi:hypothetical protein